MLFSLKFSDELPWIGDITYVNDLETERRSGAA